MQFVYTMFITSPFFSLVVKGKSAKISKVLTFYGHDCLKIFLLFFMFLLAALVVKIVVFCLKSTLYF